MKKKKHVGNKLLIGRNEWCQLPDLNIPAIKAKIDTGAKTSAIHAFNIKRYTRNRKEFVSFLIHPLQAIDNILIKCHAPIFDKRYIMSSNGHKEHRYIIRTVMKINSEDWDIEMSLSNRDPLRYRLLLGREALSDRVLIDPSISCNQSRFSKKTLLKIYSDLGES